MSDRNAFGMFLVGFLLGSLSGAVMALLFAPQSGEETRTLIKDKTIELRDKAQQTADQARTKATDIARQVKEQGQTAMHTMRGNGTKEPQVETIA